MDLLRLEGVLWAVPTRAPYRLIESARVVVINDRCGLTIFVIVPVIHIVQDRYLCRDPEFEEEDTMFFVCFQYLCGRCVSLEYRLDRRACKVYGGTSANKSVVQS